MRVSSTLISRAFIPPCILKLKDCLSRTSRLAQQAGTLDAHFIEDCANGVPSAPISQRMNGFAVKHRLNASLAGAAGPSSDGD